jgi:hypothetical protein
MKTLGMLLLSDFVWLRTLIPFTYNQTRTTRQTCIHIHLVLLKWDAVKKEDVPDDLCRGSDAQKSQTDIERSTT